MNFDLNNINKKIIGFFAVLGFVLSFISGLISGNNFINLVLNSFISAIALGVIIVLAYIVIANFLPELIAEDDYESEDGESLDEGRVNIVMPEEGYQVQSDDSNFTDGNDNEVSEGGADTGFKEVGLDNLANLSTDSFSSSVTETDDDSSDYTDSGYTPSSNSSDSTGMGQHSPEELAKAVKTVLKKE